VGDKLHAPAALPSGREAEWASGPVWTGVENLAPTWIRSADRPASSESPYRLSYLDVQLNYNIQDYIIKSAYTMKTCCGLEV
jgi:hypothetical protein